MKTIPPVCTEPDNGVKYFRSVEQLAGAPETTDWLEREFPAGASELKDEPSRREFLKLMSASIAFAGLGVLGTGCRRPEQMIYPFGNMPEGYVYGVPQYYATAFPSRGRAIPVLVKSNDGRPTKIEGNKVDTLPDFTGSTDLFAQASILNLYDSDRARRYTRSGNDASKADALDGLRQLAASAAAKQGEGLAILLERGSSPSRERLLKELTAKLPKAKVYAHDPLDFDVQRRAATALAGKPVAPYYQLDAADVVVSLDCDFVGAEEDSYRLIRGFAKRRKIEKKEDKLNRLYVVEGVLSQTGTNADHRLRLPTSQVFNVAAQLAAAISADPSVKATAGKLPLPTGVDPKWVTECANDLKANAGKSLVIAGHRQPLEAHLLAQAINAALGNLGKTVVLNEVPATNEGTLEDLAATLNQNTVDALVILGSNPAYTAPANLKWANAQAKAKTVVALGYYEDETAAAKCDWHLPLTHYLESWGDARTADGTIVPVQPLIQPLFNGITELEVLARLAGSASTSPYDITRDTFKTIATTGIFEENWKKFLHDGYWVGTAYKPAAVAVDPARLATALASVAAVPGPTQAALEVVFTRDYSVDDGRYANNGWCQEVPDPITKIVWGNAVLISRKTADDLQVKNTEVVRIKVGDRTIEGPIWIQPGLADNILALALGYGRKMNGRIANFVYHSEQKEGKTRANSSVGFNAYDLRADKALNFAGGATLEKTNATQSIACTQDHWSMEGRPIIREGNLKQFVENPKFAQNMGLAAHFKHFVPEEPNGQPKNIYQNPYVANPWTKSNDYQWGMVVDLNQCVGCSACVIACQSENNIPVVGKDQVRRGREMHWMRLDRYYTGIPGKDMKARFDIPSGAVFDTDQQQAQQSWIDDPQVINQPMMCQHCENAPCESVCPVNATVHDGEGLNLMAYNRCVGTRYCSNNCAWKVRRFNFFDFNKRPLENLYKPEFTRDPSVPEDQWDLLRMVRNPDVTVRMRGVMEKCTFCVQRIEQAKIAQQVKAGQSGAVVVPAGVVKTACQQVCPAEAITFGNLLDADSAVSKAKTSDRNYSTLAFLDNRPRTTYLARIRNPNPAMPDYKEMPNSMIEYIGNPADPNNANPAAVESAAGAMKGAH